MGISGAETATPCCLRVWEQAAIYSRASLSSSTSKVPRRGIKSEKCGLPASVTRRANRPAFDKFRLGKTLPSVVFAPAQLFHPA